MVGIQATTGSMDMRMVTLRQAQSLQGQQVPRMWSTKTTKRIPQGSTNASIYNGCLRTDTRTTDRIQLENTAIRETREGRLLTTLQRSYEVNQQV